MIWDEKRSCTYACSDVQLLPIVNDLTYFVSLPTALICSAVTVTPLVAMAVCGSI